MFLDLNLEPGEHVWIKGIFLGEVSSGLGIEVSYIPAPMSATADKNA